jgi:DNA-binding MarR family transcriptional regulator
VSNRTDRRGDGFRVPATYGAEHPEADPTATDLIVNLLETSGLIQARLDRLLREHDLSIGSFNVMQIVAGAAEAITPTQIAQRIRVPVTTATVTGVLDTLERGGWLARTRHPTDRRRVLVEATEDGRVRLGRALDAVIAHERTWTSALGKQRRVALADELGTWQTHLRAAGL